MVTPTPNVARSVAVVLSLYLAVHHLLGLASAFHAEAYVGTARLGALLAALASAAVLLADNVTGGWWFAGLVGLVHVAGYVVTRTMGLPLFRADVDHWLRPSGLATACAGALLGLLAGWVLAARVTRVVPAGVAHPERYAAARGTRTP